MKSVASGREITVDAVHAASKSAKHSNLALSRVYAGPPVDVYSVSADEMDGNALCKHIAKMPGDKHKH